MKSRSTIKKTIGVICATLLPMLMSSQIDLTVGLNYAYNPPSSCNNQITGISVDVCNNGSGAVTSSFIVGIYLYDAGTSTHWVLDQTTINSLSGSSCVNINNWDINMNNYASLPAPGNSYRLGVWIDTANAITETSKSNNASLLSGNIQVCAPAGIKEIRSISAFQIYPNPASDKSVVMLDLIKEEKINISVNDILGKPVLKVFEGTLPYGHQKLAFQTDALANGVYFVNVNVSGGILTRKLIIQH